MGALPRPEIAPGPHRALLDALHDLHHRAGWPSLRTLAATAGCSHTTVSHVFSQPRLPSWGSVELIVESMHGDVAAFHELWLAASGSGASGVGPGAPRLAGRRAELDAVRDHLDGGHGVLLVSGEAGIGKTRLVEAASQASGAFVASGACLPLSVETPLLPVVEVLRAILDHDPTWFTEALASCPAFVTPSLTRLVPELPAPSGPALPEDLWSPQHLRRAVGLALVALARSRPLGVVLEDLHWADGATLDLTEALLVRRPSMPVILTWRAGDPDVPEATRLWHERLLRSAEVTTLALTPLTRDETAEQIRMVSGTVDDAQVDRIHRRSLGLPLFTEQLAASAGTDLPHELEEVLNHRLEGLSEAVWRVARTLGIAGRGLTHDAVARATGLEHEAVTAALHDLRDRHLLRADRGVGRVELRHPLLAEAVVRLLMPGEERLEHERLAGALAGEDGASPAEVAAHWQAAGEEEHELAWRLRAARAATDRFAPAHEAEQLLRALALWPDERLEAGDPPVSRVRATFSAMSALEMCSRTAEASALVQAMMEHEEELDPYERAELLFLAADYAGVLDSAEKALGLAERGVALLETQPPGKELVAALRTRSWLRIDAGRFAEASADIDRAIAINDVVGDAAVARRLRASQAWFDFEAGRHENALARIAEAARPLEQPDPMGDIFIAMYHTDMLLQAAAPAEAVAAAGEPALAAAATFRIDSQLVSTTRSNVAEAWLQAGDVDRAARTIGRTTDQEFRHEDWALHLLRAQVEVARGRLEQALARVGRISAHRFGAHAQRDYLAQVHTEVLLWSGRPAEAWDCARRILRTWAEGGEQVQAAPMFVLSARAAADATTPGVPDDMVGELVALRGAMKDEVFAGDRLGVAHSATYDAELARATGRRSAEQWLAAAGAWDAVQRPHQAAYCWWHAARAALAEDQGAAAARLLTRALRSADQHVPLSAAVRATRAGQLGAELLPGRGAGR